MFVQNRFTDGYKATIGADYYSKNIQLDDNCLIQCQFWGELASRGRGEGVDKVSLHTTGASWGLVTYPQYSNYNLHFYYERHCRSGEISKLRNCFLSQCRWMHVGI